MFSISPDLGACGASYLCLSQLHPFRLELLVNAGFPHSLLSLLSMVMVNMTQPHVVSQPKQMCMFAAMYSQGSFATQDIDCLEVFAGVKTVAEGFRHRRCINCHAVASGLQASADIHSQVPWLRCRDL